MLTKKDIKKLIIDGLENTFTTILGFTYTVTYHDLGGGYKKIKYTIDSEYVSCGGEVYGTDKQKLINDMTNILYTYFKIYLDNKKKGQDGLSTF